MGRAARGKVLESKQHVMNQCRVVKVALSVRVPYTRGTATPMVVDSGVILIED